MPSSLLSHTIKRTSNLLLLGTSDQIMEYEDRFQPLKTLHDRLFSNLIVSNFSLEKAYKTAQNSFSSTKVRFAGADGPMYSRSLFDLVILFGGAYASTGTITFAPNSKPTIQYDVKTIQQGTGISIFTQADNAENELERFLSASTPKT